MKFGELLRRPRRIDVGTWRRNTALKAARFGLGPAAPPRRGGRPLPLAAWMLGLGIIAIGFVAYNYWNQQYELILVMRQQDPVDHVAIAEARNDILRNTLTAIAGFAAAAVLLLNFQKQRHEEYNATQQRIADLRIQAVEQLGSESPSVRIGGLHNLERLGESHPELRQIVLDEICSYLRLGRGGNADRDMSPGGEPGPDATQARSAGDEAEVRLIALEILQRHLRFRTRVQRSRYWSHTRINLKNAILQDLDFSDCLINEANFQGAQFHGETFFGRAQFQGDVYFGSARFHGRAFFVRTHFQGNADFLDARFHEHASFEHTHFQGHASFHRVLFNGHASFGRAQFYGYAAFHEAQFNGHASFGRAQFYGYAGFQDAQFREHASLEKSEFYGGGGLETVADSGSGDHPNGNGAGEDSA